MAQQVYKADNLKWWLRNLKILLFYSVLTIIFWWIFATSHDPYCMVLSVLMAILGLGSFIGGLFSKPRIVIDSDGVKFGRTSFKFSDLIDVKHKKDEYSFFLASRRRVTLKLNGFSENDKKEIDKLLAERCLEHITAGDIKEKITGANLMAELEFCYTAKHTQVFFQFALLIYIFTGIAALSTLLIVFTSVEGGSALAVAMILLPAAALVLLTWFIEKKRAKCVFSFSGDTFTFTRKDKIKFSFLRGEVQGVGINPNGQAYIVFRISGRNKKIRLPLTPFSRANCREMKDKIRAIFFLPEQKKQNTGFTKFCNFLIGPGLFRT